MAHERAEIVVVGAGHNGLICAAYLARGGFDTLLLEARPTVGGCASTVEDLGARFNICNCDHTMIRAMPVLDELELTAHGLAYLENEAGFVNAYHDGSPPWIHFHEIDRTLESLAAAYPAAVDPYRRYLDDALPVAALVLEMARTRPTGPRFVAGVAGRRAAGTRTLLDWSRHSADEILARYFDDWRLSMPAIATGPTVWGVSPETPGTGLAAAAYATRHLVKSGRPRGGSGGLTDAVRASFEAAGGRVRCNAGVDGLVVRDGSVTGVRLADGTFVESTTVVAACDPHRVFVDWVDDAPPAARRLVRRWVRRPVLDGYESKVDAVLEALPSSGLADRLPASLRDVDVLGPTTVVSPNRAELAEAHRLRAEGRVHDRPTMLMNIPSVLDPTMRPEGGGHVLSLEVLFTPYALAGGWPASDEPSRWLELWAGFAGPGSRSLVRRFRAMTPDRYEAEFSLHRGHTPAFSASPLSTLVGRRARELTRYRTPISGLYLSGAGTFPGAGVFGASGRNAADVVRRDLRGPVGRRVRPLRRGSVRAAERARSALPGPSRARG